MNAEDLLKIMKTRRSYRMFETKQISEEQLRYILEAGLYAPNAGSRQSAIFLVTQDAKVNNCLGKINRQTFKAVKGRQVNSQQPSIIDDPNIPSAFYGAPTVITLLAPRNFIYGGADCCVAGQNMMLMAHALGLGSCMIARGQPTMDSAYGRALLLEKGIDPEQYCACYHIIVGYPKGKTLTKDRENRIYW